MDFNVGAWIVKALEVIESSTHVKIMAYGLVLAVMLHALAQLLAVL